MKKLPIGIQTFSKIINENYLYIDKTKEALYLIENYSYAFISRPRRFGKSLFIDTLQNIFEGEKELFKGLHIYDKWDWESKYSVIKIDWRGNFQTTETLKSISKRILKQNQNNLSIVCEETTDMSSCFD